MSHEDYKERAARFAAEAERRQSKHEYTRITPTDCMAEVWRCKQPETSNYAFDIVVTRYGIASFGDIGGLTFNVGASYGIKFLAGNDVEYYIHQKLDQDCKRTELDEDYFTEKCIELVLERLQEDDLCELTPPAQESMPIDTFKTVLSDWLWDKYQAHDDNHDLLYDLHEFIGDANASSAQEAYDHLSDNSKLFGGIDYWEYGFERPAKCLIQHLYMLRHAAIQILKVKHPAAGSAIGSYGSMGEEVES